MTTRTPTIWKKLRRRDLPLIALAAMGGIGAVTQMRDDAEPTPVKAVAPSLQYLTKATVPAKPETAATKPGATMADLDHSYVTAWVSKFTGSRKHDLATTLDRMEKYDGMITAKLAERGMPKELVYLALIESGGNPRATSPVKAKGLWQFMAPTAKQYGLAVGGRVDERLQPEKATDAALDYLSDLHERFGSWYLAAAAYNTGQGRVSRILKQVTGKSKGTDADFYRIAPKLPKETRDYVPKLVAVARIAEEPAKYGFADVVSAD